MRLTLIAVLMLAACTPAAPPEGEVLLLTPDFTPPAGYPPVMGDISGKIAGQAVAWQTYDFSIGAFDASAWIGQSDQGDGLRLTLIGHPVGDPDGAGNRISIIAQFAAMPENGAIAGSALIKVFAKDSFDTALMSSAGKAATVQIDHISRDDGAYGDVSGTAQGTICDPTGAACRPVMLTFKTRLQFDSV